LRDVQCPELLPVVSLGWMITVAFKTANHSDDNKFVNVAVPRPERNPIAAPVSYAQRLGCRKIFVGDSLAKSFCKLMPLGVFASTVECGATYG